MNGNPGFISLCATVLLVMQLGAVALAESRKSTIGKVFRCEKEGQVTYSDTVCEKAPDKTRVIIGRLNSYSADPPSNAKKPKDLIAKGDESDARSAAENARKGVTIVAPARRKPDCKKLAADLNDVVREQARIADAHIAPDALLEKRRLELEKERTGQGCQ